MLIQKQRRKQVVLLASVFIIGILSALATVILNIDIFLQVIITIISPLCLLIYGIVLIIKVIYCYCLPVENRAWPIQTVFIMVIFIIVTGATIIGLWAGNNLRLKYNQKQVTIIVNALEEYHAKHKTYPQDLSEIAISIPKTFGGGEFYYYSRNYTGTWFFHIGFWAREGRYDWNNKTKQFKFSMR